MNKNRVALIWAALILAVASASAVELLDEQVARFACLVIVLAALIHIGRAPCAADLGRKDS
jgi:hypothetical protein